MVLLTRWGSLHLTKTQHNSWRHLQLRARFGHRQMIFVYWRWWGTHSWARGQNIITPGTSLDTVLQLGYRSVESVSSHLQKHRYQVPDLHPSSSVSVQDHVQVPSDCPIDCPLNCPLDCPLDCPLMWASGHIRQSGAGGWSQSHHSIHSSRPCLANISDAAQSTDPN